MSNPRVLRMNELSSTRYDDVPLPARQQLGDFDDIVDVDARSGNGLRDYDLRIDERGADYQGLDPEHNGHRTLAVTYHLDTTEPNMEPEGGPGSEPYTRANRASTRVLSDELAQHQDGVILSTQGNATLAVQHEGEYINTQREVDGRQARYAQAVGMEDQSGATKVAGSGGAAFVIPSQSIREENGAPEASDESADSADSVPTGTISSVKAWVGDDEDKARQALEAESKRETPRQTLVEWLQDRTGDNNQE